MEHSSGVGVLDKAVLVLDAVAAGAGTLAALVERTGLSRATTHRLAVALEVHGLLRRDDTGRWLLGPHLHELTGTGPRDRLLERAQPVLAQLRDSTGESAQLYRRSGPTTRVCVAAAERGSGLRDTVPVGAALPMTAGSAAQVLLAWTPEDEVVEAAAFSPRVLADVRRRGWAHSVAEREQGVASVSAPVRGPGGEVVAAVSVSGPLERLTRSPGRLHAAAVVAAAGALSRAIGGSRAISGWPGGSRGAHLWTTAAGRRRAGPSRRDPVCRSRLCPSRLRARALLAALPAAPPARRRAGRAGGEHLLRPGLPAHGRHPGLVPRPLPAVVPAR